MSFGVAHWNAFNGERFLRVCRHTNEVCWCYGPFGLLCVNRFVKILFLKWFDVYIHACGACMVVVLWL